MNRWIVIGVVVVLAVLLWGAAGSLWDGVPVQAARLVHSEIREFIDEQGKTRLPSVYLITMPFDGRIEPITLREGDRVKQGQTVAQVVSSDLENAIAEARAAVQRLEASIRENDDVSVELIAEEQSQRFVESMASTVAAARERMTSGKAKLDYAEKNLARVRRLAATGAETEDDLDRAQLAFVESQVDYRQDALIWRSMVAIQAATELLPKMVRQFIDRKTLARDVLEKQKSEAEARLSQMLLRQQRGTMTSPVSGQVLERLVENERHLAAGTVLLRFGTIEELEIETDILSQEVVDIKRGDPVEIYGPAIGARPGEGVPGHVQRIFPAGFTKISSLGVEQQRVRVIIEFAEGVLQSLLVTRDLGVDYRVRVRIFTAVKEAALVLPRSAIFRGGDNRWQVFAIRGQRAIIQPVEVGMMNDELAEIVDGLRENELVVLAPESSLVNGTRVEVTVRR